jgi:hypothetical protein
MRATRKLKECGKSVLHRLFVGGQRFGISILPVHYYSSVPDLYRLAARADWKAPHSMTGIAVRPVAEQLALLQQMLRCNTSIQGNCVYDRAVEQNGVGGYGPIESEVLGAFVSSSSVTNVVQVGCGVSTAVMLDSAARQNKKLNITCIEPYPNDYLRRQSQQGRIVLIEKIAQLVEFETYTQLKSGDLLFIDSTHTVAPGSEVNRIIFEILPRLDVGVWVHFHDIYFPYDYARDFLSRDLFFPQETALLYAFLLGNRSFSVELSMSILHYSAPAEVRRLIPTYQPQGNDEGLASAGGMHFPSSVYLKKIGGG